MDIDSKYFPIVNIFLLNNLNINVLYLIFYNKFTNNILDAKIKNKNLINESDIFGFVNNSDLDKEIATLTTKAKVKVDQDKIAKLQAFHSSYFHSKSYFENDGTQKYLVFQPIHRFFKNIGYTDHIFCIET